MFIGGFLGFVSNYHQQYLYRRKAAKCGGQAPPEARLIWAAYGGLLFPLGLFAFAWTGRPSIPWIVPMIFLCLSYWGIACIFSAILYVFLYSSFRFRVSAGLNCSNYLADAYETYSSSAQAAQSVARNLIAAVLPLVARRMVGPLLQCHLAKVKTAVQGYGISPGFIARRFDSTRVEPRPVPVDEVWKDITTKE